MITEDYVSFEVAKLLKEKGFDVPCLRVYDKNGIISIRYLGFDIPHNYTNNPLYLCPTLQMTMKWLREKHHLHILPEITDTTQLNPKYYIVIWDTSATKSYIIDLFDTYEEAINEGIKYCLENLVKKQTT